MWTRHQPIQAPVSPRAASQCCTMFGTESYSSRGHSFLSKHGLVQWVIMTLIQPSLVFNLVFEHKPGVKQIWTAPSWNNQEHWGDILWLKAVSTLGTNFPFQLYHCWFGLNPAKNFFSGFIRRKLPFFFQNMGKRIIFLYG